MAATTQAQRRRAPGKRRLPFAIGGAALALLLTFGTAAPAASDTVFEATYAISLSGLTVGAADVEGRFADNTYAVTIKGETSGISRIVSDARATFRGSGRIFAGNLLPASYDLETREDEFETHVRMKTRGRAVSDLLVIPRLREHPDRIPIGPEHTRDIVDPVAAFLVVADKAGIGDGERTCRRTIKVFDGWQRYDVRLSYKETRMVEGGSDAYAGGVVACSARYVPVAGHRMSLDTTRYMAENERLEVWYAPIGDRRLLVPYRILIGTAYGDLVVVAKRFVVGSAAAKPAIGN